MRFEYQFYAFDGDFLHTRDDTTVDTFALGIDYELGGRGPTVNSLR